MKKLINQSTIVRMSVFGLPVLIILILVSNYRGDSDYIKPVRKTIIDAVFASGYTINSDEYMVATNTEGFILNTYVKEGDSVNVGDLLFQLSSVVQSAQLETALSQYEDAYFDASPNSPQLLSAMSQIEFTKSQLKLDLANFERYAKLVETNAVSTLEYEKVKLQYEASVQELAMAEQSLNDLKNNLQVSLKNAENNLKIQKNYQDDYFIRSAKQGLVLNLFKNQGELAKRGEILAKIGSGTTIAKLFIAEEDINLVSVGQQTQIALNTNMDQLLDAYISNIYPSFDVTEQSFILEATFKGTSDHIFANSQLQANIIVAIKKDALVIPSTLVNDRGVVTLSDNSEVPIDLGIQSNEWVEVISGINDEDLIRGKN